MENADNLGTVNVSLDGEKTALAAAHRVRMERVDSKLLHVLLTLSAMCSIRCGNGTCTLPDNCTCHMGWAKDMDGSCTQGKKKTVDLMSVNVCMYTLF